MSSYYFDRVPSPCRTRSALRPVGSERDGGSPNCRALSSRSDRAGELRGSTVRLAPDLAEQSCSIRWITYHSNLLRCQSSRRPILGRSPAPARLAAEPLARLLRTGLRVKSAPTRAS